MRVLSVRNVCEALPAGLSLLLESGEREHSRAGPVLVAPWPVTTVYERPTERVLFSAVRDANPFFHLIESLWMLAGRHDAALLNRFVADFGVRFAESASGNPNSENDGRVHGAYGYRWRRALGFDQLDVVVAKLRTNSQDRQCVIQMWDARYDEGRDGETIGSDDLRGVWKDRPCNTHVYLRVRGSVDPGGVVYDAAGGQEDIVEPADNRVLDITVCCRSNDIVWGAYGANAVHFSVLQEYLAARVGVGVGTYYQVSNNFHVYERELEKLKRRGERVWPFYRADHAAFDPAVYHSQILADQRYTESGGLLVQPTQLVDDPDTFDEECAHMLKLVEALYDGNVRAFSNVEWSKFRNKFLTNTVWPMVNAHRSYKRNLRDDAEMYAGEIAAADWRTAATEWIDRRWK